MADWIKWTGGDCPVDKEALVKVRFACDHSEASVLGYPARPASFWQHTWKRRSGDNRIIAYMVIPA